jgi:hypothetical protein
MVQTATSEIQTAFYSLLVPGNVLDATLASLGVTGVFDERAVSESQPFDYITIGDFTEKPNNTLGRRGYDNSATIHLWSRQIGQKPAQLMVARINQLIDQQHLTLASQAHVYTMYDMSQYIPQPDGLTLHVPIRYMLYSEE